MAAWQRFAKAAVALSVVGSVVTACGGGAPGSPPENNVPHPLVRQFSPTMSPIDFDSGQANPTYTDGLLTQNTDPAYPGKIVVFFNATTLDAASAFQGGDPGQQLDPNAVLIQRATSLGNVVLDAAPGGVQVLADRIVFTPATMPLPDGQYSVAIFGNLKSVEGDSVDKVPAFHAFTVGTTDSVPPMVVTTSPANGASGVGAGVPAPTAPSGTIGVGDVRTAIFGPTSPDIVIRFSEPISSTTVTPNTVSVVDASAFVPGGGAPPAVPFAPGFPKLKSQMELSSLPSNGFEVIWRADPATGGLPFGATVQVTVVGSDGGANSSPIADRSGNQMAASYVFQFQTIAPPKLPENPEPEYAIYWTTKSKFGVLDTVNQSQIALAFLGQLPPGTAVTRNSIPLYTDTIATQQTLGVNFDPNEISVDARTNGVSCHTFCYVQSEKSGEIVIINSRTSLPVGLLRTPGPGGLSNQTGGGQAANVLVATNSAANTFTVFDLSQINPGLQFLTGPILIRQVNQTGNTPKAIAISAPATGAYNREGTLRGPGIPLILYVDYTDGVLNTANLGVGEPVTQMPLGKDSTPNDVSMTACVGLNPILFGAVSQGGRFIPGEGAVSYYIAGPGCQTGVSNNARPDFIVGTLNGFDAPAGLDNIFPWSPSSIFAMAESGSTKNQVVTLALDTGSVNPKVMQRYQTGSNPIAIAHPPSWFSPGAAGWICQIGQPGCPANPVAFTPPPCWYEKLTEQFPQQPDLSGAPALWLYVCVRGAGRIEVIQSTTGALDTPSKIAINGIRNVGSTSSE